MRTLPYALGFVYVLLCFTTAFAGQTVGWVEGFKHDADNYKLIRNGIQMQISTYAPLESGDRLSVLEEPNEITLFYTDGHSVTLNHKSSPYIVQNEAESPSVLGNMADWAQDILDRWKSVHQPKAERMEMRSRSLNSAQHASLSMPMLQEGANRITAGTRDLFIAWDNGQGPFEVTLTNAPSKAQTDVLFFGGSINARKAKLPGIIFEPGQKYILVVTDSRSSITRYIVAVDGYEQPERPRGLTESALSEEIKKVFYSAWLAENYPDWRLEAYQSLTSVARYSTLAGKFQASIVKGTFPK